MEERAIVDCGPIPITRAAILSLNVIRCAMLDTNHLNIAGELDEVINALKSMLELLRENKTKPDEDANG